MKILVIHGSMRKGNTYHLTEEIISRLRANSDVEVEEVSVKDLNLPFCVSCHTCFTKGEDKCPHRSILEPLVSKIMSCDALVLSGVVYSMHLNAAMKNLIDHLSYFFHRPCLFDTKGLVVSTTAGSGEKVVAKYLKSTMGVWGVNEIRSIQCKIQTEKFALTKKQQDLVAKETKAFYESILENTKKQPSFNSVGIYNAFRGMNSGSEPLSQCDKEYWQSTGMIDKVYPYKIGFIRKLYGLMSYSILKKVFSKKK